MNEHENHNPTTMPPHQLLDTARRHGIHWYVIHGVPNGFFVWGDDEATSNPIVTALRDRRDELIAMVSANRPASLPVSAAEERFRADVLNEPNMLTGEIPWPVLKVTIGEMIFDALAIERMTIERERENSARDNTDNVSKAAHR